MNAEWIVPLGSDTAGKGPLVPAVSRLLRVLSEARGWPHATTAGATRASAWSDRRLNKQPARRRHINAGQQPEHAGRQPALKPGSEKATGGGSGKHGEGARLVHTYGESEEEAGRPACQAGAVDGGRQVWATVATPPSARRAAWFLQVWATVVPTGVDNGGQGSARQLFGV